MKNHVSLIGRIGEDPKMRTTTGGRAVCNFSLATNERRKNGDKWEDHTEWHRIVAFGQLAGAVHEHCRKGKLIAVEGKLSTRKWEDEKDKITRWTTEILADSILFLADARSSSDDRGGE